MEQITLTHRKQEYKPVCPITRGNGTRMKKETADMYCQHYQRMSRRAGLPEFEADSYRYCKTCKGEARPVELEYI